MTDHYVQSIDVEVGKAAKYMQWAGIVLILASLGFILLSAFYSWWFTFGFVALMTAGGVLLHFYNKTAKEYTYEFSRSRLRIIAKDVVNRQRVYLDLLWKDVKSFEIMTGAYDEKRDLLCANKSYDVGVCQIVFRADNQTRRLLFVPDEYMSALVKETLKDQSNG